MKNNDNGLKDLNKYIDAAQHKKVLVIGDVMLDRFVYGSVNRISPESDAPVLDVRRSEQMPGGAGNVVVNLRALGIGAVLVSVIGNDAAGRALAGLLPDDTLIMGADRPTTRKTRYVSGAGQLLRVDEESRADINAACEAGLLANILPMIGRYDAVVLSDYNKGVLTPSLTSAVIKQAREDNVLVLVDPKKSDYTIYQGAFVITPNRKELSDVTGLPAQGDEEIAAAARKLMEERGLENLVVTRSEDGMAVFQKGNAPVYISNQAGAVIDVSGAGDTAIAGLALGIAAGASLVDAARLANYAGGLVVAKSGTASIDSEELKDALENVRVRAVRKEHDALICGNDEAAQKIADWKAQGLQVGFTNGCFDILHYGHVSYLNRARDKCDRLVVGLNHDQSVKILKGPERPLHDQDSRAAVIGALSAVDMVVFFGAQQQGEDNTPCALIGAIRPDIYFKGGDYTAEQLPETKIMDKIGGRTELMDLYEGHSTTSTIEKMKKTNEAA